jgi:16S rRNA G527 N7-methylase RsmG
MAIQLYCPHLQVYLIEKSYKKSLFLSELSRDLALTTRVFQGFAESFPAWKNVDLAVMRALRPSAGLLDCFEKSGVSLLLLHGRKQPHFEGWQSVRRERFPLSKNRWATQFGRFT